MNKTAAQARDYVEAFLQAVQVVPSSVEIVLCAPFTALQTVSEALAAQRRVRLGAQNMHWEQSGAFTGEISASMLVEWGARYVIIGHSERRQYFGETDDTVRLKTAAALKAGLTPIVAVGEPLEIRMQGDHFWHVTSQTRAALDRLDAAAVAQVVLAYEPVWAIGTGKNCDPSDANAVMRAIRKSNEGLASAPILYGGSVKPENMAEYAAQPDIDGALVGGASLDPEGFAKLAVAAA